MKKIIKGGDMVGQRFGKWVVLAKMEKRNKYRRIVWLCKCSCGEERGVCGSDLRNGQSQSCGCARKETLRKLKTTHGMGCTKIYEIWQGMKARCYNPNHISYKYYGAKGIKVCDYWLDSFENFYTDMGLPKEGMSIDRKDSRGNYEPSNCKWATKKEQMRNMTRNKFITFMGRSKTIAEWAEELNINYKIFYYRVTHWPQDKVFHFKKNIEEKSNA